MQPKVGDQPDDFGFMTSQRHLEPESMKSISSMYASDSLTHRSALRLLVMNRDARHMTCHEQYTQIV